MKKFAMTLGYLIWLTLHYAAAQDVNWRAFENHRHVAGARFGADVNTAASLFYGQKISQGLPILVGAEFTVPFGETLLDDWKLKLTAQGELLHSDHISIALKPGVVVRRLDSDPGRLYNVSVETGLAAGYQRPKWGIGAEAVYDRSLATNIRHKRLKEYYPDVRDGWYGSTGGTIKAGITANYSFHNTGIFLKAGQVLGQDLENNPTIPFYLDLSVVRWFGRG